MGLIMITHDMGVVAETAERVVVQYKGRKMEEADVLSLFQNPKSVYTRALLAGPAGKRRRRPAADGHGIPRRTTPEFRGRHVRMTEASNDIMLEAFAISCATTSIPGSLLQAEGQDRACGQGRQLQGGGRGKTLAIVGESGCGKSTLARMVTMIDPVTDGRGC
jgi:ABC-type glutathione transport system ATPase component